MTKRASGENAPNETTVRIRDRIRELRRVPASTLAANPKNWRRHPENQKKAMRAVLEEIGYADALLAREEPDGKLILIDGHLRADTTPDEIVPVLILDVTETEGDKILATLDPLAAMAELDLNAWGTLLDGIESEVPAFAELLAELHPELEISTGLTDENDIPDPPQEPVSRPGDLWILGSHRLLCGDSTVATDVTRLLSGTVPILMVSDPPYGVEYRPAWRNEAFGEGNRSIGQVRHDDRADWREAWALFPGDVAYVWHAGTKAAIVTASLATCDFEIRSQIIWAKPHFAISRGHYHVQHEPCWYAVRKGRTGHWQADRKQTTLWQITNGLSQGGPRACEDQLTGHGTQKPVECMRRPILNHTNPGQAVYDPFLGSGSTLIAAETTGRSSFGLEIDPRYTDVAVKRWQAFTGKTAILDGTTMTFDEVASHRGGERK